LRARAGGSSRLSTAVPRQQHHHTHTHHSLARRARAGGEDAHVWASASPHRIKPEEKAAAEAAACERLPPPHAAAGRRAV